MFPIFSLYLSIFIQYPKIEKCNFAIWSTNLIKCQILLLSKLLLLKSDLLTLTITQTTIPTKIKKLYKLYFHACYYPLVYVELAVTQV